MTDFSLETRLVLATIGSVLFGLLGYNAGKKRSLGGTAGALLGVLLGLIGFIIVLCFRKVQVEEYEFYDYEPPVEQPSEPMSAADEIEKLKRLLDSGAITREEFNIQKAKIFGR